MCKVTVQSGINVNALQLAIRETCIVAAEAEAQARQAKNAQLRAMGYDPTPQREERAQGDLFADLEDDEPQHAVDPFERIDDTGDDRSYIESLYDTGR